MSILFFYLYRSDSFWCEQKINESFYCISPFSNDWFLNNMIQLSNMIHRISSNFHLWPASIIKKKIPTLFLLMITPAPYILGKWHSTNAKRGPLKMDLFLLGGYTCGVENICTNQTFAHSSINYSIKHRILISWQIY